MSVRTIKIRNPATGTWEHIQAMVGPPGQDGLTTSVCGVEQVEGNVPLTGEDIPASPSDPTPLSNIRSSIDLLWTNSSPGVAFAPQTVSIPTIGDYDLILIHLKHHITDFSYSPLFVLHRAHANSWAELKFGYVQNDSGRRAYCAAGGVAFDQGFFRKLDASYGNSNDYGIPVRIYGVRL